MSFLIFIMLALVAGIVATVLILGSQFYFRRQRQKRFQTLELIPNILMTRFPLLFIGRPRSIFRVGGDFLELPLYLQEHGYEVEEIELLDKEGQTETIRRLLANGTRPVHLIVSENFSEAAYDLALDGHPKLATLTLIGEKPETTSTLALRPTRLPVFERPELRPSILATSFVTEQIALEHMVSLAEYDLR